MGSALDLRDSHAPRRAGRRPVSILESPKWPEWPLRPKRIQAFGYFAVGCLAVGAALWPAGTVQAQTRGRRGVRGGPAVVAQVALGSLVRSADAISFRIAVEVPDGHHGYVDKGDDGFFIPFSFSFPGLEEVGVVAETTSTPLGVRDQRVRAQVLRGRADFAFRLVPAPQVAGATTAGLRYQICNDVTGICYPPKVLQIPVAADGQGR
ncbi:MAG TPA: hypothetical protein EYQ64_07095 [Gemmatimonadetes bacterium]|nr:hypothetical protein [Gemmatimonadota bacterium]